MNLNFKMSLKLLIKRCFVFLLLLQFSCAGSKMASSDFQESFAYIRFSFNGEWVFYNAVNERLGHKMLNGAGEMVGFYFENDTLFEKGEAGLDNSYVRCFRYYCDTIISEYAFSQLIENYNLTLSAKQIYDELFNVSVLKINQIEIYDDFFEETISPFKYSLGIYHKKQLIKTIDVISSSNALVTDDFREMLKNAKVYKANEKPYYFVYGEFITRVYNKDKSMFLDLRSKVEVLHTL